MIRIVQSIRWKCLAILLIAGLLFSSCQTPPDEIKSKTDEYAYSAIEKKWDEKFGIKANYKMRDVPGAEPNLLPEKVIGSDGILTIPEAVLLATANNRLYQLEKDNLYTKALDLRLVRHLYEPHPFGVASSTYTDTEDASNLTTGGALGFSQLLASGGAISASISEAWVEMLSGDLRSGVSRLFSATFTQPLLRGAGREAALEQLTQAEQELLYQVRYFNHFRQLFVVQILSQYYGALERQERVGIAEDNYTRLDMIYQKTQALTQVGKVAPHELEEIEQERMIAKDAMILAQSEYRQLLDELKLALAIPPQTELTLDRNEFLTLKTREPGRLGFTEQQAIDTAVSLRLDMANASDAMIDAERKVRVAYDRTRPGFNLVGSVNQQRNPDRTDNEIFSGGATLDIGLDRTIEKTEYRRSLVMFEQSKRTFEERRDTVSFEVRSALRKLQEANDRYILQTMARDKADKRLENTLLLLHYARANTRDILRSQQDAYDARNAATDAVIDFAIATLEFYRDTGILQVKPDGMWQVDSTMASSPASGGTPAETVSANTSLSTEP